MTTTTLSPAPSSEPVHMASLVKATAAANSLIRRHDKEEAEFSSQAETVEAREDRQQGEWDEASAAVDRAKPAAIIRSNRSPWTHAGAEAGSGLFVEANFADNQGGPFLRISNSSIDWTHPGAFVTRRQLLELLDWAEGVGFLDPELGREGEEFEECQITGTNAAEVLGMAEN